MFVVTDFSAVFDTLDRVRLLTMLKTRLGIHGTALSWIESCLTGRDSTCENQQHGVS